MKRVLIPLALLAFAPAFAQSLADAGKTEYLTSCAGCHGAMAKGDGPVAKYLTKAPTDLTTLARRNGGVFPTQRVYETIDGRTSIEIGPHGSREMPAWGQVYRSQAMEPGAGELAPYLTARSKMAALMDYLLRIQVK